MKNISSISSIIDRYDALILDLWGVVHDGSHLYPGVHHALEQFKSHGKKVVLLSNAPRRAKKVVAVLEHLGLEQDLYIEAMSSGEMGYRWLKEGNAPWGKRYYYIGPEKDEDILDGLGYGRAENIAHADFLLNVGFGSEYQDSNNWKPVLEQAKKQGLPMLCLNPDLVVVKQTGEKYECAGVIGQLYEQLGGEVTWFGKPFSAVYEHCFEVLKPIAKKKILAVGDSLETDIPGAQRAGIDSVLVTGGILKIHSLGEIEQMCRELKLTPQYTMPHLVW